MEEDRETMEAETGAMQLQGEDGWQPPDAARGKEGPSTKAFRETRLCQDLDWGFLASRTVR